MLKFIEFITTDTGKEMKLFAIMSDGNLVHIRDYVYLYEEGDLKLYSDANGAFVEAYCYGGVSYEIRDGKLFEYIQDRDGIGDEWEITLPMLLA